MAISRQDVAERVEDLQARLELSSDPLLGGVKV